jgi:hypothetical protein
MPELKELTEGEKDTVLYFHDQLLSICHRSGMTPDISTAAVMMLSTSLIAQSPLSDEEIIKEFTRVLKRARIRVAMKQKEGKLEQ